MAKFFVGSWGDRGEAVSDGDGARAFPKTDHPSARLLSGEVNGAVKFLCFAQI